MGRKRTEDVPPKVKPDTNQIGKTGLALLFNYLSARESALTFNPVRVPLKTYDMMRNSPTIAAGLSVVKEPIIGIDWKVTCEDERQAKYLDKVLRGLWPDFIRDLLMGFDFGFSVMEKVYEIDPDENLVRYARLLPMDPTTIFILIDANGSFDGVKQNQQGGLVEIPADKLFLYTHKREYGNFYGRSRLRAAYQPWLYAQYILQFAGTYFEKYGMPMLVGYAPPGTGQFKGTQQDNVEHMQKLLDSAQSATSLTLPYTKDKKYSIDKIESNRTGGDYIAMMEYLDRKMWEGIMVPELAMKTGDKGSYALFEEQASIFAQAEDAIMTEIKDHIDRFLLRPLSEMNWGPAAPKAEFAFFPIAARDRALMGQLLMALVQNQQFAVPLKYISGQLEAMGIETGIDVTKISTIQPAAPKTPAGGGTAQASRQMFARAFARTPFPWEKDVNFSRIKDRFESQTKALIAALAALIGKQEDAFVEDVQRVVKDSANPSQAIADLSLKYRGDYRQELAALIKALFDAGKTDVEEEHDLNDIAVPLAATQWLNSQASVLANKHLDDMESAAQLAAISSLSQEVSAREITKNVRDAFSEYEEKKLPVSAAKIVHKAYEEGRDWTAEQAGLAFAIWSSILDDRTCEFCVGQDGMVVRVDDPDFTKYSPGNVHANCRCVWVFTDAPPSGSKEWATPSQKDVDQYYDGTVS